MATPTTIGYLNSKKIVVGQRLLVPPMIQQPATIGLLVKNPVLLNVAITDLYQITDKTFHGRVSKDQP